VGAGSENCAFAFAAPFLLAVHATRNAALVPAISVFVSSDMATILGCSGPPVFGVNTLLSARFLWIPQSSRLREPDAATPVANSGGAVSGKHRSTG